MIHLATKELFSERLILRKFKITDVKSVFNNRCNDDEVSNFMSWTTHKSENDTLKLVSEWVDKYKSDNFYQWAIVLKGEEENGPIGGIGASVRDEKANIINVGFCIGKKWRGQGITTEALKTIIPLLFDEVKVNRIEAGHEPANIGSGKVMIKCELQYEGTLRQCYISNNGLVDNMTYSILAEDYYKQKKPS